MNREKLLQYIRHCFACALVNIDLGNAVGCYDSNRIDENIVCRLLNAIYGWHLINANVLKHQNFPGVDLVDEAEDPKIVVSVSSERSREKVRDGLRKAANLVPCHFYYMAIGQPPPNWGPGTFLDDTPDNVEFACERDVLTFTRLLRECGQLPMMDLVNVYEICRLELGSFQVPVGMACAQEAYVIFTNSYAGNHEWLTCDKCAAFLDEGNKWLLRDIQSSMTSEGQIFRYVCRAQENQLTLESKVLSDVELYGKLQEIDNVEKQILALSERAEHIVVEKVEYDDYVAGSEDVTFVSDVKKALELHQKLIKDCLLLLVAKTPNPNGAWQYFWKLDDEL